MRIRSALALTLVTAALSSCGGDRTTALVDPTPNPAADSVRLRDIVIPSLPAPYYHFAYDSTGRLAQASFASGFTQYDVVYDHDHIAEMRDHTAGDQDRLVYIYDRSGRVAEIHYVDESNIVYVQISFAYAGSKLVGMQRTRIPATGSVVDKTTSFTYDANGNLYELTERRPAIAGVQEATTTVDRFEQYDDRINVDAFSLLHSEFFDHLVLLPGVQLQRGNPARVTHTGDGVNYRIDYTYTYDAGKRPLTRTGAFVWLNGADAGKVFQTFAEFSYY